MKKEQTKINQIITHIQRQHHAPAKHNYSLDIVRILACAMVVLMHSPTPNPNASSILYGGISYLTSPCIGLFFMVSGALLLPTNLPLKSFIKKRLGKILFPTLIWTVIYLILLNITTAPKNSILIQILSIPFSPQGHGVLWFMYTLTGIYILTPIISPWLKSCSKNDIIFILLLWSVTLFFPLIRNYLQIREDSTGLFYYFSGYAGYYIAGFYIKRFGLPLKNLSILLIYGFCIFAFILTKITNLRLGDGIFWYLGIFTVAMCVCIFNILVWQNSSLINRFIDKNSTMRSLILSLSKLCFGIYLIHVVVMRYILWNMDWYINISNCFIQTLICFSLTFIISYILVLCLSKLPYSKYIIAT